VNIVFVETGQSCKLSELGDCINWMLVGAGQSYKLGDCVSIVLIGARQSYKLDNRASWVIV
jgi:hypothetical protein